MGRSTAEPILKVAVNAPLPQTFDYLAPEAAMPKPGCRVRVPFGRRRQTGMILDVVRQTDVPKQKLRRAEAQLDATPVLSAHDLWLVRFASDYYHHPIGECVAAALPSLLRQGRALDETELRIELTAAGQTVDLSDVAKRAPRQAQALALLRSGDTWTNERLRAELNDWPGVKQRLRDKAWIAERAVAVAPRNRERPRTPGPKLNAQQQRAVDDILLHAGFRVSLLDGITGSGKTEVYLQIMQRVLDGGRQVLVLVPEIGLTPQFLARLEERLGTTPAVLHSSLTDQERLAAWRDARQGDAKLVLGTRSAVFAPLANPGLIVVDEEHDTSFKQQEGLRYSARDLAVARAKRLDLPVILGSATPSLESLHRAADGVYRRLVLNERAGGAVPPLVRLIDLERHSADAGLSAPLANAISRHIDRNGQALVFINRRGYAPTLICSGCGHVADCQRCDSRMTVHRNAEQLACHHCGATRAMDTRCNACGSSCVPLGHGTERIEETLRARFPACRIIRVDSDSTRSKGAMDKALAEAHSGDAQILVGTQLLSKGHHFPRLSLVGVINADQGLFSTDFRAAERLAQSLVQVAGRAGREREQGEVLIQTAFAKHPFWHALLSGGYPQVAELAIAERQASGWPPYSYLALIRASAHQREYTFEFLDSAAAAAQAIAAPSVRVLGPVSAPMARKAGRFRGQLLLQSGSRGALHGALRSLRDALASEHSARRVRWSVDVDPIELF